VGVKNSSEVIAELPFYIIPIIAFFLAIFSGRIKNIIFASSLETKIMKDFWKFLLNFGIDGDFCLAKWKRKNFSYLNAYFRKSRDSQLEDPIYSDAYKLRKFILERRENKRKIAPITIVLEEIMRGKVMSKEEIIEKVEKQDNTFKTFSEDEY